MERRGETGCITHQQNVPVTKRREDLHRNETAVDEGGRLRRN